MDENKMMLTLPWLQLYIGFSVIEELWSIYVNYRQYNYLNQPKLNNPLKDYVSENDFRAAINYSKDKLSFSAISSIFGFIIHLTFFLTFAYVYFWKISGKIAKRRILFRDPEYLQAIVFLGILYVIETVLNIGFEIYYDFVLEQKYGFNKKTPFIFIKDKLLSTAILIVLAVPLVWLIIWIVKKGGKTFYIFLWVLVVTLSFLLMWIYPNVIAPLFSKFESLQDQELKKEIEDLAESVNFPLKKIYQVDASRRSAHSNAYFYGLGSSKRIVLFDTLLFIPRKNILAVLAHEIGHWKYNHITISLIIQLISVFIMFYLFGLVFYFSNIYESFGFDESYGKPVIIGLFLFFCIYEPIVLILKICMTVLSRKFEFQADSFASKLGCNQELQDALLLINKQNFGNYCYDPLYAWMHLDHPHLVERLDALKALQKKF